MIQKIKEFIHKKNLIEPKERLVLGVSGGADSVALLYVLMELKREFQMELVVVHINHGIRQEAFKDAAYVETLCEEKGIPFYLLKENIPALARQKGKSVEEMGRIYRYRCFREIVKKTEAQKIVVAHHENDQAETVLFHMLRGTGIKGLSGMEPMSIGEEGIPIIRPFLCVNRREIEEYLEQKNICWCQDVTNQDNQYARNQLRNVVLPAMEEINRQTVSHICRLADDMKEYADFFEKQVESYIEKKMVRLPSSKLSINREDLIKEPPVFAKGVLYALLCNVGKQKQDLTNEHVEALYALLFNQSGKSLNLPYGITASLMYENLILGQSLEENTKDWTLKGGNVYLDNIIWKENQVYEASVPDYGTVRIECKKQAALLLEDKENLESFTENVKNHYTKYFDCDKIIATLCLRTQKPEDYLCINGNGNTKKISRYFKDEKILGNQRNRIPLLAAGHEILDIVGYRRCEKYKVLNTTDKIFIVTYEGEKNGSD